LLSGTAASGRVLPTLHCYTLETALITTEPVSEKLAAEGFFTYLIVGEELFD
jgi:hypothetical protein